VTHQRENVRVPQQPQHAGLCEEQRRLGGVGVGNVEHLDRNLGAAVPRPVHRRGRTGADCGTDREIVDVDDEIALRGRQHLHRRRGARTHSLGAVRHCSRGLRHGTVTPSELPVVAVGLAVRGRGARWRGTQQRRRLVLRHPREDPRRGLPHGAAEHGLGAIDQLTQVEQPAHRRDPKLARMARLGPKLKLERTVPVGGWRGLVVAGNVGTGAVQQPRRIVGALADNKRLASTPAEPHNPANRHEPAATALC
jgi:hypothetical protein